jgi:hypothetical protein
VSTAFNPYAPPQSEVSAEPAAGAGVSRAGRLVRMRVEAPLPDRCIRCNGPADGYRLKRAPFWRPDWWRWTSWGSVLSVFALGWIVPEVWIAFWPVVILVWVIDMFVRRRVEVGIGLCRAHRRLRAGVLAGFALCWLTIIAMVAGSLASPGRPFYFEWFWVGVVAMLAAGAAVSLLYRMQVSDLQADQMWLKGAGKPFLESLPAAE